MKVPIRSYPSRRKDGSCCESREGRPPAIGRAAHSNALASLPRAGSRPSCGDVIIYTRINGSERFVKNTTYRTWGTDSSVVTGKDAENEFEFATRAARSELKREHVRADSNLFKALRSAAPMDLEAISSAQANLMQALAIAGGKYRQALASAERLRLCATLITEGPIDRMESPAIIDPFDYVRGGLSTQPATAHASWLSPPTYLSEPAQTASPGVVSDQARDQAVT